MTTNVLIMQRPRHSATNALTAAELHFKNRLLIAELDDEPEAIGVDPMALKAVHAVQVSTEPLAEIVRQWNPNVMVFENQIAELPPMREFNDDPWEINLFYGAQNRQNDWKPIMPALNRVLGDHPNVTVNVVHDREFFDAIKTDRKQFFPFEPYETYRGILSMCDIALLPLEPGRFNECKSDLKFLECAAEGVYVIGSKTVYSKTMMEHTGYGGTWYETPLRFELLLRDVINNDRHLTCETAYAYVRDNRLLGQHFRRRLAWYQELLSSKSALDRQLWERVPELAPRDPVGSTA